MRKNLEDHVQKECPNRDYECEHCGEEGTYAEITEVHDEVCQDKIIPCPNEECGEEIMRKIIDDHVDECDYTVIPCKYEVIGCNEEMIRKDMKKHKKDDAFHLHMAIKTTRQLKREVALKSELRIATNGLNFKLTDYEEAKVENEFMTPSFYTHPGGYHMKIEVNANGYDESEGTHVSVYAYIVGGEYDDDLKWPLDGYVTITLLNQLGDHCHFSKKIYLQKAYVGKYLGIEDFIPHTKLGHNPAKNTQYLMNDTLYFRVLVDVADHKPWLECTL